MRGACLTQSHPTSTHVTPNQSTPLRSILPQPVLPGRSNFMQTQHYHYDHYDDHQSNQLNSKIGWIGQVGYGEQCGVCLITPRSHWLTPTPPHHLPTHFAPSHFNLDPKPTRLITSRRSSRTLYPLLSAPLHFTPFASAQPTLNCYHPCTQIPYPVNRVQNNINACSLRS